MRTQELAGGYWLLLALLALPKLQQRLEHMQTVVDGTEAEQSSGRSVGDERRRLENINTIRHYS